MCANKDVEGSNTVVSLNLLNGVHDAFYPIFNSSNSTIITYQFCNNDVEVVDKCTYLGSIITNTGDLQPDINCRIGLAAGVMRSFRQPLRCHQSSISLETKLRVYQASELSVHGSECWPISTSLGWVSRSQIVSQNLQSICDKHTIKLRLEKRVTGKDRKIQ